MIPKIAARNLATTKDVLDQVNRLAQELMKAEPGLSQAAARKRVWEEHPELAQKYEELRVEEAKRGVSKSAASQKHPPAFARKLSEPGAIVLEQVSEKARTLQRRDPSLTRAQARTKVWERHPELAEEYQREIRS